MNAAARDLTAGDFLELAFREAQRGVDRSKRINQQLQIAKRMKFMVSRASSIKARLGAVVGKPEAVVKHVRKGGVKNAHELRRQINYLTVRAEGVLDIRDNGVTPLDADQVSDLIETWAEDFNGKTNYGYTRHMIVSFPEGTYPDAAHEAGLEFADRLFGSGDFGDTWDYLTVFHNDTDNPHVHIVVNNRGVEHGQWLAMGMSSEMNIDVQRSIQVEVAEEYGIELTATTRLERGLRQEVATDTWKVQAGMSVVETTPEVEATARDMAADVMTLSIARMSDLFDERANAIKDRIEEFAIQLVESEEPMVSRMEHLLDQAHHFDDYDEPGDPSYVSPEVMSNLRRHIELGGSEETNAPELKAQVVAHISDVRDNERSHPYLSAIADIVDDKEFQASADYAPAARRYEVYMQDTLGEGAYEDFQTQAKDLLQSIDKMEGLAREVDDPHLRVAMDIQIGELKGDVTDLRANDPDLQAFIIEDRRYSTMMGMGTAEMDVLDYPEADKWAAIRNEVTETASSYGLDGEAFVARFGDHHNVTLGTTMGWRSDDISTAAAHFNSQGLADSHDRAEAVVDELHQLASSKIIAISEKLSEVHALATHPLLQGRGVDDGHSL
ncbi:Relaxase/Mobilisation nuclease domain-containing protein [Ruegeria halocynthiae]|uniref:Relaxase/Mobilisation nuclease domain-containing protein n=1 Tax=Ruegeria halocynthiae TaxID=985054 RepID=A0A1H3F443_9RHOB|nr:relaxase/mobilization nuclease domain-containing protein [Ruegeria halocynthiae]SDX85617.1 Relaxase/Mobilisation nuclease domain-containing protein [Ruegeria halocynthiae]